VCSRHLQDVSHFCSLQCKLDSMAGVKYVSLRQLAPLQAGTAANAAADACCGSGSDDGGVATAPAADCAAHSSGSSARSCGGGPETPLHPASLRALDAALASDSECM
jgi:hypothetical protein